MTYFQGEEIMTYFQGKAMIFRDRQTSRNLLIKRINQTLEEEGITKVELAEKMGVSKQMLTNSLSSRQPVSLERLMEMATLLGLRIEIIF